MAQLAWEHREILVDYAIPIKKNSAKPTQKLQLQDSGHSERWLCNGFYKNKILILVLFLSNSFVRDENKGFCREEFWGIVCVTNGGC